MLPTAGNCAIDPDRSITRISSYVLILRAKWSNSLIIPGYPYWWYPVQIYSFSLWEMQPNLEVAGIHVVLLMFTYYKSQASSRKFGIWVRVSPLLNACIKDGVIFIILRWVVQNLLFSPPFTKLIRLTALLVISRSILMLQEADYPCITSIVIVANTIIAFETVQNISLPVVAPWVNATTLLWLVYLMTILLDGLMPWTYLLLVFLVAVNLHPLLKRADDIRDAI